MSFFMGSFYRMWLFLQVLSGLANVLQGIHIVCYISLVMTTLTTEEISLLPPEDAELKAMIDAGVHIGHTKSKRHPAMEPYIWMVRNGISIIDLVKTKERLMNACVFLQSSAVKNGIILFVGTRPAARAVVKETATALGMPYVTGRWIGGTLTNFKVIGKRIEALSTLEHKHASGELEKYTKKERMLFEKQIEKLRGDFDGLRLLGRLPVALVVANIPQDHIAIKEAARMRIPVVALADTNTDPKLVTYPVPSNDDAESVIRFMMARFAEAVERGKHETGVPVVPSEQP